MQTHNPSTAAAGVSSMTATGRVAHAIALSLYLAILALLILTTFWPEPVEGASVALMLTIKLVPLLLLMPGLLKGRNKTYQWLCFVILIYFTDGILRAYLSGFEWPPTLMAGLTTALFVTAIVKIRATS